MNAIHNRTRLGLDPAGGKTAIHRLVAGILRRRRVNRTIAELSRLSDATLRDIGIERGNIAALAERALDAVPPQGTSDPRSAAKARAAAVGGGVPHGAAA